MNDEIMKNLGFEEEVERKNHGFCAICGLAVSEFRNEISKREWEISGMCHKCQDSIFGLD